MFQEKFIHLIFAIVIGFIFFADVTVASAQETSIVDERVTLNGDSSGNATCGIKFLLIWLTLNISRYI